MREVEDRDDDRERQDPAESECVPRHARTLVVEGRSYPLVVMRLIAMSAAAVGLLALTPAVQSRPGATPALRVTFAESGAITVTLADGTPVGTAGGAPTTIPAGYYTLLFFGPGECINLPLFELRGPGVNINDDMLGGETDVHTLYATFLPNTTYTWRSDRNASIVYSFRTTSDAVSTPSSGSSSSSTTHGSHAKPTSQDIVGSAILPFRGTLTGTVTAAGRLTLAFNGRSVTHLKAGRYRISVVDRSSTDGFMLAKAKHTPVSVTGGMFLGKRSLPVTLSAGTWLVLPRAGKPTYSIVVA
jgi:hypothetical protein